MTTAVSDYNLTTINSKELGENLRASIEFGSNMFVIGRRGSSITIQAKKAIKDTGCKEVFVNLSVLERVDLAGFPSLFSESKDPYVSYKLPYYFRDLIEGDTPCVLLADEIDKCDSSITAPLLEITQFHTVNGVRLKNLRSVLFTANHASEGSAGRISPPLMDRTEAYKLEMSHIHWLDWAGSEGGIHPSVTAFINDHPDELFGEVDAGDLLKDQSPRGWENASKMLWFGEKNKWGTKIMTNKVAGNIGKKTGVKYASYFAFYQELLPVIEKIMKGEKIKDFSNLEQGKQVVATMIACSRLSHLLDAMKESKKKELPKEVEHVGSFLSDVDPEIALISVRSQIGLERVVSSGIDEYPTFDSLLKQIAKRIKG